MNGKKLYLTLALLAAGAFGLGQSIGASGDYQPQASPETKMSAVGDQTGTVKLKKYCFCFIACSCWYQ